MTINIIPGARWGRRPWAEPIHAVPTTERQHFLVHYDGGTPITRTGKAVPQAVDKEHHGNGWAGIGYNFLVDQAGNIYEGRLEPGRSALPQLQPQWHRRAGGDWWISGAV